MAVIATSWARNLLQSEPNGERDKNNKDLDGIHSTAPIRNELIQFLLPF